MKIFSDKDLKSEVTELNLGIVEAGESKDFTFYVKNDSNAELKNLNFAIEHKEVTMLEFPKSLIKYASAELKIKWFPSVTLKEGLKAKLLISGLELWE